MCTQTDGNNRLASIELQQLKTVLQPLDRHTHRTGYVAAPPFRAAAHIEDLDRLISATCPSGNHQKTPFKRLSADIVVLSTGHFFVTFIRFVNFFFSMSTHSTSALLNPIGHSTRALRRLWRLSSRFALLDANLQLPGSQLELITVRDCFNCLTGGDSRCISHNRRMRSRQGRPMTRPCVARPA